VLEMIGAELRKTFHKKRFWVFLILMAIVIPLGILSIGYVGKLNAGGTFVDQQNSVQSAINEIAGPYNLARNMVGITIPVLLLFLVATFSIFLIGEDRSLKMWKVIFTSGRQRIEVFAARFFAGMAIFAILLTASFIGAVTIGGIGGLAGITTSGLEGDWGTLIGLYVLQWLVLAAPLTLGFFLAWIIAAPAVLGVILVFLPVLAESVVTAIVGFAAVDRLSPLNAGFQPATIQAAVGEAQKYYFTRNLFLGPRLYGESIGKVFEAGSDTIRSGKLKLTIDWGSAWWSVGVSLAYAALFLVLTMLLFVRRDVHD
jgi:ABC-type transport system involved in multi-copper enzyme maturation permease subunit